MNFVSIKSVQDIMNKRYTALSLALAILISVVTTGLFPVPVFADDTPPDIDSEYYILMDADSGIILCGENIDEQCYPASVTKLMTALIVAENASLTDTLIVSSAAVKSVKYGDSNAALKTDEEFSIADALNILLIKSANDMAYALAEHVGGSIAGFTNMMNKKAVELGCTNTHFSNASGLTDVNHYTTPHDMALIAAAVIDNQTIMSAISRQKSYSVEPTNKTSDTRYYRLSHSMITGNYKYPYCIGGKTGYTDAAGHTLATFAEKDGLRLVCIVFRSTDEQRYIDTTALFEYGFNNFHKENISEHQNGFLISNGIGLDEFGIDGKALSDNGQSSFAIPSSDYVLLPNGTDFSMLTSNVTYNNNDDDNCFANITYYLGDRTVGETRLMITDDVTNADGLPVISETNNNIDLNNILISGHYIFINVWLLIGAVCVVILVIVLVTSKLKQNKIKRSRGLRFK